MTNQNNNSEIPKNDSIRIKFYAFCKRYKLGTLCIQCSEVENNELNEHLLPQNTKVYKEQKEKEAQTFHQLLDIISNAMTINDIFNLIEYHHPPEQQHIPDTLDLYNSYILKMQAWELLLLCSLYRRTTKEGKLWLFAWAYERNININGINKE